MGTSRSFRSPATPRWHSVLAHIANDEPHEVIRAELFNAGNLDGWNAEFGRGGVSTYVEALIEAHETFGRALRSASRPEEAIEDLVVSTRQRALREDASPTIALAERALARTLISTAREDVSVGATEPREAAAAWERRRGTPADLVGRFLGEVLHQFTSHVIARDAGQIVGRGAYGDARAVRLLERSLAREAQQLGSSVEVAGHAAELPARWPSLVNEAFRRAAIPPERAGG